MFAELKSRKSLMWFHVYWLLFDLLWVSESAVVQLHVNVSRSDNSTATQRDLPVLLEMRRVLLQAIFRTPHSDPPFSRACIRGTLTTSLLCWNIVDNGAEVSYRLLAEVATYSNMFRS